MRPGNKLIWLGVLGMVVGVVLVWLALGSTPPPGPRPQASTAVSVAVTPQPDLATGARDAEVPPGPAGSQTAPAAEQPDRHRMAASLRDHALAPRARQTLLANLQAKLAKRTSLAPAAAPKATGSLSKEYLQAQMREIVPLVRECYEMELEQQPKLAGDLKVQFRIIGDEAYGGLVVDSQILSDSSLVDQAGLVECVRESMYALQLKAPAGGGEVTVTYPFKFNSIPE